MLHASCSPPLVAQRLHQKAERRQSAARWNRPSGSDAAAAATTTVAAHPPSPARLMRLIPKWTTTRSRRSSPSSVVCATPRDRSASAGRRPGPLRRCHSGGPRSCWRTSWVPMLTAIAGCRRIGRRRSRARPNRASWTWTQIRSRRYRPRRIPAARRPPDASVRRIDPPPGYTELAFQLLFLSFYFRRGHVPCELIHL